MSDKYETSPGSDLALNLEKLQAFVSKEEFFTSQSPSLKTVAEAFGTHRNSISRLINQQTDGNFSDFVNGYRIQLAIKRLRSPGYRHLTIEGIGKSVGFRSKSSFHQAFKKRTGLSPAQYVKEV